MNNNIVIRPAKIDDCSGITILTNQLGYPSSQEKVREVLKLTLSNSDHQIFVAQKNSTIVGYIHIVCTIRLGSDPFVEIAAIIVHNSHRNQGIGNSLLEQTQKWSTEKGYKYIRVRSNIIRESTKFFEDQGYTNFKTQQVFIKEIK
jgi:N-acetylglutamate synthase-like GNAT family acetyltransferase